MALDKAQREAVEHYKGPAMILAGPGSGKTTVITHRLKYLTEVCKVEPKKILVITFTKMAALQMKERYLRLCDSKCTEITFGTFHAVFFMILKNIYSYKATDIIKTNEQRALVKMHLMAKGITVQDENAYIHDIMSEIAKVKGQLSDMDVYQATSCESELFREIYVRYDELLKCERKVDFEDMMISTFKVLQEREDILKIWQELYEYILVDEFQDAAPVQFEIVKLLGARHRNIFVVGDDDQSIYGFRGAAPDVMKAYERAYADVKIYHLDTNYRCTGNIVKAATTVINKNKNRFYKNLRAFNEDGVKVKLLHCDDVEQEYQKLTEVIKEYLAESEGDIAILTRTHMGAGKLAARLEYSGLKFRRSGKKDDWFNHWISLDMQAYVRIALGSEAREDYIRIINKPLRYIDRIYFDEENVKKEHIVAVMRRVGQHKLANTFNELLDDLERITYMPPFAGFNYIMKKVGYEKYIKEYAKETGIKFADLESVIRLLGDSFKQYESYERWLEQTKEGETPGHTQSENCGERIIFSTMHGAKGLEYDAVIIPDVNEGITPYSKAVTKEDIEEERRLFYVAMTRAKKQLIISYADKRYNKYVQPSRFLRELHHNKSCV